MIQHAPFGRRDGSVLVDPVGPAVADIGARHEAAVGAAVDRALGDGDAVAIDRECRLTAFEAGSEVRFAACNGNGCSPCRAAGPGIEADQVQLATRSLVDIIGRAPLKIIEEAIAGHGIPERDVKETVVSDIALVSPENCPVGTVDPGDAPWRLGAESPAGEELSVGKAGAEEAGVVVVGLLVIFRRGRLEAGP